MKKLVSIILVLTMLVGLCACGTQGEQKEEKVYTSNLELYKAELPSFDYHYSTNSDLLKLGRITQGFLINYDQYGLLRPEMAAQWSVSADALTYTFYLEPGNYWYDYQLNKMEEVKAEDWITAAKHILNKDEIQGAITSQFYNIVAGAKEYWEDPSIGFDKVGVKALDKYTLQYTLKQPTAYFLKFIAGGTSFLGTPTEYFAAHKNTYGMSNQDILYCGPYVVSEYEPEYQRVLTYNPNYKDADKVSVGTMTYRYNLEMSSNGPELFLRGEADSTSLSNDVIREWKKDPEKAKLIHPNPMGMVAKWLAFNFDPHFDEGALDANWQKAVNNINFRKCFFYGLNKFAYNQTLSEDRCEEMTLNTVVFSDFVSADGKDYLELSGLDKYSKPAGGTSYNKDTALAARDKAKEELAAKGVTFPVTCVIAHPLDQESRMLLLKQQLEELLGTDFIKFQLESYAGNAFQADIKTPGKWYMIENSWGPDYPDPKDSYYYLACKAVGGSSDTQGKLFLAEEYYDPAVGYGTFDKLILEADKECVDMNKRYAAYAKAEVELLNDALCVPLYRWGVNTVASKTIPFTGITTMFGINLKLPRYHQMAETSCSTEEFYQYQEAFYKEVAKARQTYDEEAKAYVK